MTELDEYLAIAGFSPRPAQTALYEHLITATCDGVIAQAGTGTGKSAAVISAAAHQARIFGTQSIIVTPTLTLMSQYRDGDVPIARQAFEDLTFTELRGRAHYWCEMASISSRVAGAEYRGGCEGSDGGCTQKGWAGHSDLCEPDCQAEHEKRWDCGYQQAKHDAKRADVVVTNADMLIVNDRILYPLGAEAFSLEGDLYVDEAHTLEQKLRDYASRSLFWKSVERFKFAGDAPKVLADWIKRQEKNLALRDTRGFPLESLRRIAYADMPTPKPKDGLARQRETQEACLRISEYIANPHDNAVLHVNGGSLKMDWVNVSRSAGELLRQRRFGLVSATIPRSMAATLGIADAPFIDVGHPFDYATQAWIGFSPYGGDYRSAQTPSNFEYRVEEVMDLIRRAKGGALVLFSSFRDLEAVADRLVPQVRGMGLRCWAQDREMEPAERQAIADEFKADGNGVLFGSESFATGFDVPGDALRLVVLWKLPYPAVDPVSNAIRAQSYQRYEDIMRVRAVQAIGRLIRRESDRGIVWVADSRGRRLLDSRDPLTSHIPQFARI